jgi:flagellar protein FliS
MSIEQSNANAYLRTKVMTASREELRLLLLDGALKFAHQGREGLATKNYELSFNGISSCRNIVLELLTTIKPEHDPELCDRVKALYSFIYTHLVEASMEKNIKKLDAVIRLLSYERETWALLMEQVRAGKGAPADPAPAKRERAGARQTLSLEA